MRWILGIIALVVVLAGGFVLIGPSLVSTEGMVERIEAQASDRLGRQIDIGSVSGVSFLPPRVTVTDLRVANAEGFTAPYLAEVGEARIGVAFWPLLSGTVDIQTFVLEQPVIALEVDQSGANNYTLGGEPQADPAKDAPSGEAIARAPVTGNIVINNGSVSYRSPEGAYQAEEVDAQLVLPDLGGEMVFDTTMKLESLPTKAKLTVTDPWRATSSNAVAATLDLDLAGNTVAGSFNAVVEPLKVTGPLTLRAPKISELTPLLGDDLVTSLAPFGAVMVTGNAQATEKSVGLEDASFETAFSSGGGTLNVSVAGERPKLTGNINADELDLRPFFPEGMSADEASGGAQEAEIKPWSEEPFDFSGMKAADADVSVAAGLVQLPTYDLTDVRGKARLTGGQLSLTLDNASAFGGQAAGTVGLDARPSAPQVSVNLDFDDIDFASAGPALLQTDRLKGRGTIGFDLATSGNSERAWVENATGVTRADIRDGRLLGINLTTLATAGLETVDALRSGSGTAAALGTAFTGITSSALTPNAATTFNLANMEAQINSGNLGFGEARVLSDTLRATIGGGVNLAAQELDMNILLAAKAPEAASFRELKAPVRVTGTLAKPKIALDPSPLLEDAATGAATDLLGKAGIDVPEGSSPVDALRDRARSELLNLFGGNKKKAESEEEGEDEDPQN